MKDLQTLLDDFIESNCGEASNDDIAEYFYELGQKNMKAKMMDGAVEGVVYRYESYQRIATAIIVDIPKESLGNKVRIIILPKED